MFPFRFHKPANTPQKHWLSGLLLLGVTVVLFAFAGITANNTREFIHTTARANGVVISQNAGKHHVEIRFTTAKGEVVQYTQNGEISYEVGDKVTVLYYPDDPKFHASTDAFGALWGSSLVLAGIGIFTLVLALLAIFRPQYIHITGDK